MADNDVQISFGASTGELQAGFALVKAEAISLNAEVRTLAASMVAAGQAGNARFLTTLASIAVEADASAEKVKLFATQVADLKVAGGEFAGVAAAMRAAEQEMIGQNVAAAYAAQWESATNTVGTAVTALTGAQFGALVSSLPAQSQSFKSAQESAAAFEATLGETGLAVATLSGSQFGSLVSSLATQNQSFKSAKDSAAVFAAELGPVENQVKTLTGSQFGALVTSLQSSSLSFKSAEDSAAAFAENGLGPIEAGVEKAATSIKVNMLAATEGVRGGVDLMTGQTRRAGTEFLRMAVQTGLANPEIVALGAVAVVATAGLAYLAYQALEFDSAVQKIELDSVVNQITRTDEQARQLAAGLETAASVSATDAEKIVAAFDKLGNASTPIIGLTQTYLPALAELLGVTTSKAAERLAGDLYNLSGKTAEYLEKTYGLTESIAASVVSENQHGQASAALATFIQGLTGRLQETTDVMRQSSAEEIALKEASLAAANGMDFEATYAATLKSVLDDLGGAAKAAGEETLRLYGALSTSDIALKRFTDDADLARSLDRTGNQLEKASGDLDRMRDHLAALQAQQAIAPANADISGQIEQTKRDIQTLSDTLVTLRSKPAQLYSSTVLATDQANLRQFDAAYRGTNAGMLQGDISRLQSMLKNEALTSADRATLSQQLADKQKELWETTAKTAVKDNNELVKSAEEAARGEIKAAQDAAKQRDQHYQDLVKTKQMTEGEAVAATKTSLDEEYSTEKAAVAKAIELDKSKPVELQKDLNLEASIDAKYNQQIQQNAAQAAIKTTEEWTKAFGTINNAFTSQIDGLLRGTETWSQAFRKAIASIIEDLIKLGVQKTLEFGEGAAKNALGIGTLAAPAAGAATAAPSIVANTAAMGTLTGVMAANTGATLTDTTGVVANTGATLTDTAVTGVNTGVTAASTTATSISDTITGINTTGVVANTVATAPNTLAIIANTFSKLIPGFASGTSYVPHTGLAVVHQGEAIIPAHMNVPSYQAGESYVPKTGLAMLHQGEGIVPASAGGDHYHTHNWGGINVSGAGRPMDVVSAIKDNIRDVMKAVNHGVTRGSHLGLSKLGG